MGLEKKIPPILLVGVPLLFAAYIYVAILNSQQAGIPQEPIGGSHNEAQLAGERVVVGGVSVLVEIADTPENKQRGLSGRSSLPEGSGMLFIFDTDDEWGIWMKDMLFPIDIIWANTEGRVVGVVENASPDSYPKVFSPSRPARYVLEVPAGFAAEHKIREGSTFSVTQ